MRVSRKERLMEKEIFEMDFKGWIEFLLNTDSGESMGFFLFFVCFSVLF